MTATAHTFGRYDFGLSDADEQRAAALHEQATIVDLLYWGPVGPATFPAALEQPLREEFERERDPLGLFESGHRDPVELWADGQDDDYLRAWEESGVTCGTKSVEVGTPEIALRWFSSVQMQFDRLPWLVKALRADDIRTAKRDGKRAGFVNTQVISGPGANLLRDLALYHDFGLRMLQLTYNTSNGIGVGCTERFDAGVTNYGVKVIRELERLGIVIDTSHCGRRTTLDACALATGPVIASHTVAEKVYMHNRGKSDEELRAIAATGGTVGVVTVPYFLHETDATIEHLLDHVDYLCELVGAQHVTLGTDYPNALPASLVGPVGAAAVGGSFDPSDGIDFNRSTAGFLDYRDYPNITRGLVSRGYSDDEIRAILGENALRVIEQVCG